jgi:CRISPR-associated endonuclease/helicase Cas3
MEEYYQALTGYPPFRWQQRLWAEMVAGNLPDAIDIPTGLGKTAIIPIWLLAIAVQSPLTLPRRLIYVVNRRTVVDQATDIAERIREKLPAVPQVQKALGELSVPSGMRLEFGGGISGNIKLSFQATRSIG